MLMDEFKEYEPVYIKYLDEKGVSEASKEQYLLRITKFIEYMDTEYVNAPSVLNNINEEHVFSFLEFKKKQGSSPSTLNAYYLFTKYFFEFMYYENYIKNLILQKSPGFIENRDEFDYFTKEEMHQILLTAKDKYAESQNLLDFRNYVIIIIVAYAGLTLAEFVELKDSDIKLEEKSIVINGHKKREIHISKKLGQILSEYIKLKNEHYDNDYLFVSRQTNCISKKAVQDMFNRVIIDSGIPKNNRKFSPRTVRHTAIKTMVENQIEIPVISNITGLDNTSLSKYIDRFTSLSKLKEALYLEENPLLI